MAGEWDFDFSDAWRHMVKDGTQVLLRPPYPIEDPNYIHYLLTAFASKETYVRLGALFALDSLPPSPVIIEHLIAALADPKQKAPHETLNQLARIGGERAIEPLYHVFQHDPASEMRHSAACNLARLGDTRILDVLLHDLQNGAVNQRARAAYALGALGDRRAVEPLINALQDYKTLSGFHGIGEAAVYALAKIPDPRAIEPLAAVFTMERPAFDYADPVELALIEIGKIYPQEILNAVVAKKIVHWHVNPILIALVPFLPIELIIQALQHVDRSVQHEIALMLGNYKNQAGGEALLEALNDDHLRGAAALSLGKLRYRAAFQPLLKVLQDPDVHTAGWAAYALGKLRDYRAVEPLIVALKRGVSHTGEALGEIGDLRAVDALLDALRHESDSIREQAVIGLGMLWVKQAVNPLIALLKSENRHVRREAAIALGEIGDRRAVNPLLKQLNDTDGHVMQAADWAIRTLGDIDWIEPLLPDLANANRVNNLALSILVSRHDSRAIPALIIGLDNRPMPQHPLYDDPVELNWLNFIDTPEALAAVKDWRKRARAALREAGYDVDEPADE